MLIKTSCNAPCNLSSGEMIAQQGADRLKEQVAQQAQQQVEHSSSVKLESAQSVPEPKEISPEVISSRVNQYQEMPKTPFDVNPQQSLGSLININV